MRTICFVILILIAGVVLAADEKPPATGPVEVPADAVKVDNLTWRHTDAEGTVWTYRQTPFGLVKFEATEDEEDSDQADPAAALIQAFDDGDQVRFERTTPFGLQRWTRMKTELTDVERQAWERAQKASKASAKSEPEPSGSQE